MLIKEYSQYCGRMKQPLQKPDIDKPSMYFMSDVYRRELDLVLLTPGTCYHAFQFIKKFGPKKVVLFVPSIRIEFISDIYNLYMLLKDTIPTEWVFPLDSDHYDFEKGHIKDTKHTNEAEPRITISYIKNPEVENIFDIVIYTRSASNYFSFYLTEKRLLDLYRTKKCTLIHIPKSSTLYGGLSYDQASNINCAYRKKLVPYDFASIEELYNYKRRSIPDADSLTKSQNEAIFDDDENFPEDYTGDVDDVDIINLLDDDVTEGAVDDE